MQSPAQPVPGQSYSLLHQSRLHQINLRYLKALDYSLLASAALPAGSVVAVAVNALASAFAGTPQIEASRELELVMDSQPGEIVNRWRHDWKSDWQPVPN